MIKEKLTNLKTLINGGNLVINEDLKAEIDVNEIENKNINISSFGFSKNSDITLKENFHIDSKNFLKAKFKKEDILHFMVRI